MQETLAQRGHEWTRKTIVGPLLRLLRNGATPERLAWSLAAGVMIGVNPLFGSSTVVMILLAWMLRLNQPASQIGVHTVYPLQILLFLPFVHAGSRAFGTEDLPMGRREIFALLRSHPLTLIRSLWTWEWHALIIWLGFAALFTPPLALLLARILRHTLREPHLQQPGAGS